MALMPATSLEVKSPPFDFILLDKIWSPLEISINSTTPFPNNGTIIIGTEYITYTGTSTTTFTGCTRGASATTAVAHSDNAAVSMLTGAMNLTGYSALAQIRKSYDSSSATAA